jgi:WD40 repeat protein
MEDMVRALQPLAAESIAGRSVATASVLTAAKTYREGNSSQTIEPSSAFAFENDGPLHSIVRKRQNRSGVWVGTRIFAAFMLLGIGVWALINQRATQAERNQKKSNTVVVAAAVKPPTDVRVEFPGHWGDIYSLAWSPDGSYLASGAMDSEVRIWDPDTQGNLSVYRGHTAGISDLV